MFATDYIVIVCVFFFQGYTKTKTLSAPLFPAEHTNSYDITATIICTRDRVSKDCCLMHLGSVNKTDT
jgi:hypothetical protein